MALSKSSYRLGNNTISVVHTHTDGVVMVYANSQPIQSVAHDEHENAVVFYEQLCDTLAELESII